MRARAFILWCCTFLILHGPATQTSPFVSAIGASTLAVVPPPVSILSSATDPSTASQAVLPVSTTVFPSTSRVSGLRPTITGQPTGSRHFTGSTNRLPTIRPVTTPPRIHVTPAVPGVVSPPATGVHHHATPTTRISTVAIVLGAIGGTIGLSLILCFGRCIYRHKRTPSPDRIADVLDRHRLDRELAEIEEAPPPRRSSLLRPPPPPYQHAPEYTPPTPSMQEVETRPFLQSRSSLLSPSSPGSSLSPPPPPVSPPPPAVLPPPVPPRHSARPS